MFNVNVCDDVLQNAKCRTNDSSNNVHRPPIPVPDSGPLGRHCPAFLPPRWPWCGRNPWSVSIFQRSCLCQKMASYGSIGNTTPPGGGSGDSEEERDSIRTPLVLPKGRRGMRRQPASQVNTHLQECLDFIFLAHIINWLFTMIMYDHSDPLTTT